MAMAKLLVTYIVLNVLQICFTAAISTACLSCICHVEGCENNVGKCRMDVGSISCGPFQIKERYWDDCGRPGDDYESCTKEMQCSVTCVQAYLRRYTTRCTGGRLPTCEDYARVHNGGPEGCQHSDTLSYWERVERCCGSDCSSRSSGHSLHSQSKTSTFIYRRMTWQERVVLLMKRSKRQQHKTV